MYNRREKNWEKFCRNVGEILDFYRTQKKILEVRDGASHFPKNSQNE